MSASSSTSQIRVNHRRYHYLRYHASKKNIPPQMMTRTHHRTTDPDRLPYSILIRSASNNSWVVELVICAASHSAGFEGPICVRVSARKNQNSVSISSFTESSETTIGLVLLSPTVVQDSELIVSKQGSLLYVITREPTDL